METNAYSRTGRRPWRHGRGPGSQLATGLVIVLIGAAILLRRMDFDIPYWVTSWKMLLIAIGLIMAVRSRFQDISWIFPLGVGLVFLADDLIPSYDIGRYAWPLGIIVVGLIIALKPRFRRFPNAPEDQPLSFQQTPAQPVDAPLPPSAPATGAGDTADHLELTAVFGGVKRIIVSKNFRGGEVVAVLGGAEVDLLHADFTGVIKIEATNVLGGTKLKVPPTWDVQSEMVAVFGGVEDKRLIQPELIDKSKTLILEGTCFMGGLEIRNF